MEEAEGQVEELLRVMAYRLVGCWITLRVNILRLNDKVVYVVKHVPLMLVMESA